MHETAASNDGTSLVNPPADLAPAPPTDLSAPVRGTGPPASPQKSWLARLFLAPYSFIWRHPGRALAVLTLCLLTCLVLGLAGLFLWVDYHLRAARRAAEQGHNAVAIGHLRCCRLFRPDQPEVLLLSARMARRGGAWSEAETLLDRYWHLKGDEEALVLERLLLRAARGETEATQSLLYARIDRDDPAAPLARGAYWLSGIIFVFVAHLEAFRYFK